MEIITCRRCPPSAPDTPTPPHGHALCGGTSSSPFFCFYQDPATGRQSAFGEMQEPAECPKVGGKRTCQFNHTLFRGGLRFPILR
jgi:hypothetical protein